jgi:hypothetical protein
MTPLDIKNSSSHTPPVSQVFSFLILACGLTGTGVVAKSYISFSNPTDNLEVICHVKTGSTFGLAREGAVVDYFVAVGF